MYVCIYVYVSPHPWAHYATPLGRAFASLASLPNIEAAALQQRPLQGLPEVPHLVTKKQNPGEPGKTIGKP